MKKVFIAMSGGVDSSVSAVLLKEQGYTVISVTMCLGIQHPATKHVACCSVESINDAKRVCRLLDIPHYVLPFEKEMQQDVVDDFVREYAAGRTPNPCVRCNQYLKFGKLLQQARIMDMDYLATGHYARIVFDEQTQRYHIQKGKDRQKDQSYFLYSIRRQDLPHILFPIGHLTKQKVRELAQKYQLPIAEKKESQDICFIPDGGYDAFLAARTTEGFTPGPFVDHEGKPVGTHQGVARYTVGQREKLGLALGYPAYVTRIDPPTNTVFVGPKEFLYSDRLVATDVNFLGMEPPANPVDVLAKVRYQSKEVPAKIRMVADQRVQVEFAQPVMAITPGQSVVFYQGDILLGGGIIAPVAE